MIEISVNELAPYVDIIHQMNQQLTDILYQLKHQMMMCESYWQGDTSLEFREHVSLLDSKFELYQETISRYASYLADIIQQYQMTEQNLKQNVGTF